MGKIKAGKYVVGRLEQEKWLGDDAGRGAIALGANQLIKANTGTFHSTTATTGVITSIGGIAGATTSTHGAGAIGTEIAPSTKIMQVGEEIITEIKLDLTGLFAKGGAGGDAIGLAGVNGAYICQLTDAVNGVIVKSELITVEVPTQTGNTLGADFDLITDTSATIAADGAVGDVTLLASGGATSAVGTQIENIAGHATTNDHYLYFCEGSTDAADCTFTAGKFIIRLTGVKTF
tara:strand:- start:462 stop:1163 length:702 start_codon:yes stop_codon:yes gene_type:complete